MQQKLECSRPIRLRSAKTTLTDRSHTPTLHGFISTNYASLTAVCYEAYPELLVFDADRILTFLAASTSRYGGPLGNEHAFMRWATRFVTKEAQRYEITSRILREHRRTLFAAIHTSLWKSSTEASVCPEDLSNEISMVIHNRAHSLNEKGTARLPTRLIGLVKRHVQFYNSRCSRRRKAVQQHLLSGESLSCEVLSDVELAFMRADAEGIYDFGYSGAQILVN